MLQLAMAQAMIKSGAIGLHCLFVVHLADICRPEDQFSPWFGNAATTMLVGPCSASSGVVQMEHHVDGSFYKTMLVGNPDGHWTKGHSQRVYVDDFEVSRRLAMSLPGFGAKVMTSVLSRANVLSTDLEFFATHQGTAWIRKVSQALIGATNAKSCDTFKWTASLGPSNVPFCLAMGEREGLIKPGTLVGAWTGGAGTTYSALLLRWRN